MHFSSDFSLDAVCECVFHYFEFCFLFLFVCLKVHGMVSSILFLIISSCAQCEQSNTMIVNAFVIEHQDLGWVMMLI